MKERNPLPFPFELHANMLWKLGKVSFSRTQPQYQASRDVLPLIPQAVSAPEKFPSTPIPHPFLPPCHSSEKLILVKGKQWLCYFGSDAWHNSIAGCANAVAGRRS